MPPNKGDFPDFPGGAYGRYLSKDLNTLLNLFARGDEGRDMSFEQLTSSPSSAVRQKLKKGSGQDAINSLIFMNDLQQFAQPVSTSVAQPTSLPTKGNLPSSEDFAKNQTQNLANQVGSIGSPQGLSEEELLEMVMSISPVGASIRGGKVAKSTLEQLLGLSKKYGVGRPKTKPMTPQDYNFRNKLGTARMKNQQTLDKHGIADPDKQGMVDPVSALLNYFSKN